jgi:branched-chain amino acid transport system permease protein
LREIAAPFWITLPASAVTGIVLGFVFGLPSLRLRGLYLAVSTLALHFVVIYMGGEYETKRGFSTGIVIEPPSLAGIKLGGRGWYFVLLLAAVAALLICVNLLRSRSGRAWRAIHVRETVAEALGIGIARYKLLASALFQHDLGCRLSVCLLPRFRFGRSLRSVRGHSIRCDDHHRRHGLAVGGAAGCDVRHRFPLPDRGLAASSAKCPETCGRHICRELRRLRRGDDPVPRLRTARSRGIWRRLQSYFLLWPFRYKPLAGARK